MEVGKFAEGFLWLYSCSVYFTQSNAQKSIQGASKAQTTKKPRGIRTFFWREYSKKGVTSTFFYKIIMLEVITSAESG